MIDALQNLAFAKPYKPLSSIESHTDQRSSTFTHVLLPLVNNQSQNKSKRPTQNTHTGSDDGFLQSGKLIKALPNPLIFTDGKNLSIDQ